MFHWTRRMPYWRTLSYFANQIFLRKPSKDIKLYLPPNNVLPKSSSGHVDFVIDTLVVNFCHKSGISSFKSRKECQTYFFWKKTLLSQSFFLLNIWNAVLTTPLKTFRQQNIIFSLIAHKSKSFGDCQIFSPEMLGSAGHVECLPRSSSFSFEVSADAKCADLITLADPFSKNIEIFRWKSGEALKVHFFLKKSSIQSKSCSSHMECSFGNSANLVVPETQNLLAHCSKVRKVLFLPEFRPLECSTGHEECLTDEHWVFLQIRFSSENHQKT